MMLTKDEDRVLYHAGYEWWMFRAALVGARALDGTAYQNDPIRNLIVEGLAVHGRSLVYFFCHEKKKGLNDWNATDLGMKLATPEPTILKEWRETANQRVAHLTGTRATSLATLNIEPVEAQLQTLIAALRTHLKTDMPLDWIGDRSTASAVLGPVGAPTPTTSGPIGATGPAGP